MSGALSSRVGVARVNRAIARGVDAGRDGDHMKKYPKSADHVRAVRTQRVGVVVGFSRDAPTGELLIVVKFDEAMPPLTFHADDLEPA
jgi:hypothetical protein